MIQRDTFDFDIGYLIKSPCKGCPNRKAFPQCAERCLVLDGIREILAAGISCSGKY